MEVTFLASESLGTRSMSTVVKAGRLTILIDPGVALAPRRYGLPPHPIELERMNEHWGKIKEAAATADVIIVTHYHYDHHNPHDPSIYKDKIVLVKHPTKKINASQKRRAAFFLEQVKPFAGVIEYSDGREFSFDDVTLRFSQPVFHGTNEKLGYVTEVSISRGGRTLVFTSDVEGPSLEEQAKFILQEDPDILVCDGPVTYMLGYRYMYESLEQSLFYASKILHETKVKDFILEHHLLRDLEWRDRIKPLLLEAEECGVNVRTAAEYMGLENDFLEANRKNLWGRTT
ncbi:MAG: MBL fold metallo-hydrolase [Candidatus Jordarchaeales archaeon]